MTYNVLLEELVGRLGGCGLYQWLLAAIVHVGKAVAAWSMITMTFSGQDPGFWCLDGAPNSTLNNLSDINRGVCKLNGTSDSCGDYVYKDEMHTVVSEWDLVCGDKWIVGTITTIQMAGVLVGCFMAGHLADIVGRKPTFFISIFMIMVFNAVAYFSINWEMYAAIRFFIGLGVGFYLTVQYSLILEPSPAKWRPILVSTPSWALSASLFALVAWGLHDWKHIHLAIAITSAPFLLSWWFVPESFRWLVTKKRYSDAEAVVASIARINKVERPDITKIINIAEEESQNEESSRKYSALDLFRYAKTRKYTIFLLFTWFAASYGYYGITFGVKSLSGNLYLNMFLINVVESPAMVVTAALVERFGRKKVTIWFYVLAGVTGLAVGVMQYMDNPFGGQLTNAIAILSKVGVACGWQAMIVFTTELYPTVVRTIAYGVHSTAARVGGMVAPQVVFVDDYVHGVLYFISGVLMMLSAAIMLIFPETKGKVLDDTLGDEIIDVDVSLTAPSENKHGSDKTEIDLTPTKM